MNLKKVKIRHYFGFGIEAGTLVAIEVKVVIDDVMGGNRINKLREVKLIKRWDAETIFFNLSHLFIKNFSTQFQQFRHAYLDY